MSREASRPERPERAPGEDLREHALHALALSCAAGGMVHRVRNPLHAMALQIALVAEKIGQSPELAAALRGHLAKLREQIDRVEDAVRDFLEAADPPGAPGLEAGRLVDGAAALFGHEARRRRVSLEAAPAPPLRVRCDAARARRLWAGLVWRAVAEAAEGAVVRLSAAADGADVLLAVERPPGAAAPGLGWVAEVAAAAARSLGGGLEEPEGAGGRRVVLRLPGEAR